MKPHTLRYAFAATCVGRVAVLMSDRGVVDLCLVDDDRELAREMQMRFPDAALVDDAGVHRSWIRAVVTRLECRDGSARFPTDLRGGCPQGAG